MTEKHNIVIVGAGISGLITAIAFAKKSIKVLLLEKRSINSPIIDQRATTLNSRSVEILNDIGIWQEISPYANLIKNILVVDNDSSDYLEFTNSGDEKMGYVINNSRLREILKKIATDLDFLEIRYDASIASVNSFDDYSEIIFENGGVISANIVLACDGKFSFIKENFFRNKSERDYKQTALIFNINHSNDNFATAVENFSSLGPFAILPLNSNSSSVVWIMPHELADCYLSFSKEKFAFLAKQKLEKFLDDIVIEGELHSYNLTSHVADKYYHNKIALIADSAHSIHPLAGQGLNLGIRDISKIVDLVYYHFITYSDYDVSFESYEKERKWDNFIMFKLMNGLNAIFINDFFIIKLARSKSLSLINQFSFIKKLFSKYAKGEM